MNTALHSDDTDHGFQIAPMVDVVFVLLLFFMSLSRLGEFELDASLVSPGSGIQPVAIVIAIHPDGTVTMNNHLLGEATDLRLDALSAFLREYRATFGPHDPVIIQPAPEVPHARLMDVLNSTHRAKIEHVTFG